MSFTDTIKELKEKIAEEENGIVGTEEAEETEKPEAKEEPPEEKSENKVDAVEEKEEEKTVETPDQMAFQRLRRTAAAAEKKAKDLEEENTRLKSKPLEIEIEEKPELSPELHDIVQSHRMSQAEKEFQSLESKFRTSNPKYDAIASEYGNAIAQSFKVQNPRMSNSEIAEKTKETILKKAANYLVQGFNPIEELFHEAQELGFSGKTTEAKPEVKEEKEIKPDLKKVAANRVKSTGMGAATGKTETAISRSYIEQNGLPTPAEWKRMSSDEKRRLLHG